MPLYIPIVTESNDLILEFREVCETYYHYDYQYEPIAKAIGSNILINRNNYEILLPYCLNFIIYGVMNTFPISYI